VTTPSALGASRWLTTFITIDAAGRSRAEAPLYHARHARYAAALTQRIRDADAVAVASVHADWVQGKEHPSGHEWVLVNALDRSAHVMLAAPVRRDATRPPRLGEWESWTASADSGGSLVAPLRWVLRPDG
jgi:hypothetical protein